MEFEAEQADEVVAWLSGADAGGSDAPAGSIPHAPLYNQGLICAGCHLRNYQVYGPPGNEALPPLEPDVRLPHDGGQTRDAFESSRFCAACHQFEPDEYALNGKLFENTFEEWKASPQAKEGKSCQSCHMPGRRHLWRGIHDKVTVQSGVGITLNEVVTGNNRISGVLTLSNTGVGHRFPTYITPRVVLEAFQQDAQAGYPGREGICRQGSSLLRHLRWPPVQRQACGHHRRRQLSPGGRHRDERTGGPRQPHLPRRMVRRHYPARQGQCLGSRSDERLRSTEIHGDQRVTGLSVRQRHSSVERRLEVDGVFIEVGLAASSEYALDLLEANGRGEIHVNRELETGVRGVFAAGDVNNGREKQVVVAAGEGARAALAAFSYLVHQV